MSELNQHQPETVRLEAPHATGPEGEPKGYRVKQEIARTALQQTVQRSIDDVRAAGWYNYDHNQ